MNLESLLKQAMELEKVQAMLYKGLEKKFSFSKEISQFWSEMARDEKGHYERMVKMHNQFSPAQLSVEVGDDVYSKVCKGLRELRLSRLEDVVDLYDACEFAAEIEDYETIAVLEFIKARFEHDPYRLEAFNIMRVHMDKLASFSDKFKSLDERRKIKAIP